MYFRDEDSFPISNANENQHIALYIIYDNALEKFKSVAEDIEECPAEAYRLLDIAHKNLLKVKAYVVEEENKLEAHGGPHGH